MRKSFLHAGGWVLYALLLTAGVAGADVTLPRLLSDGMVLQRGVKVPVTAKRMKNFLP